MIALLLAFSLGAQAQDPGRLNGMWRTQARWLNGEVRSSAELLAARPDQAWGRLLWVFDDRSLTLAMQVASHPAGPRPPRDGSATRTTWCQAQITLPLTWVDGKDLDLPDRARVRAAGSRSAPSQPLVARCELDLPLGHLVQVPNGAGVPRDSVTLSSLDGHLVYILRPDGEAASLERFVGGD